MRALQYEGTRAEIAQGFRERGNEMAREKRWKDGKEFYTKGLAALKQPQETPPDTTDGEASIELDLEAEAKKEKEVEEACYINRALCNLELRLSPSFDHSLDKVMSNPASRKLPLLHPRLCIHPAPKPPKHQGLLPLHTRSPRPLPPP